MHAFSAADVDAIADDLHRQYADSFSRAEVGATVHGIATVLVASSRHPEFLHVLIERQARAALTRVAAERGVSLHRIPRVVFVCRHNEGRSPMAAALAEHYGGAHVEVHSGGVEPFHGVNPVVVQVLHERGIDISERYPQPVVDDVLHLADVVVHFGSVLPGLPGRRHVRWEVPDPHEQQEEAVRAIRDQVEERVLALLGELGIPLTSSS